MNVLRCAASALFVAWVCGGFNFGGFAAVLLGSAVQRLREVRS
jgi:hypothetical protein